MVLPPNVAGAGLGPGGPCGGPDLDGVPRPLASLVCVFVLARDGACVNVFRHGVWSEWGQGRRGAWMWCGCGLRMCVRECTHT